MRRIIVRAPVRADLAGGTLDLWPLYLFHPGSRTVNVAISYHAESEIIHTDDGAIELHLTDQQYRRRYESQSELNADPKAQLIARAVEHFHLNGISIITRTDAPRGSGLGGSSALSITLVRALSEIAGSPVEGEELITLVRDLETRLLGVPAGIQDYYPPVFGGLGSLHLEPGHVRRVTLALPVQELTPHFVLHYTGVAHFSGTNNWEMYKRQIDGDEKVRKGLAAIAKTAIAMEKALEALDIETAGAVLQDEWRARKELIDGISTPEIESAIAAAIKAGAWGGKVCGAGGGGCIVFLMPADRKADVIKALSSVPGKVVDAVPVPYGLTVEEPEEGQSSFSFARGRRGGRSEQTLDQLYVSSASGDYKPFVFAEAIIAHHDSRSGIRHDVVRSWAAPMSPEDGRVLWDQGIPLDPESLEIRAVPDPRRGFDISLSAETLMQRALQAEESLRQYLCETERLQIFHNPALGLYSEVHETRDAFVTRCLEEANRRLADEAERLESTFRRRIDQLRERSEREHRDAQDEDQPTEASASDVGFAWGQALYNITSGRPATTATEAPQTVREVDYMENISQIQRAWERERDILRDDLHSKARSIEEAIVAPSPKNIEIARYLILWATDLSKK